MRGLGNSWTTCSWTKQWAVLLVLKSQKVTMKYRVDCGSFKWLQKSVPKPACNFAVAINDDIRFVRKWSWNKLKAIALVANVNIVLVYNNSRINVYYYNRIELFLAIKHIKPKLNSTSIILSLPFSSSKQIINPNRLLVCSRADLR